VSPARLQNGPNYFSRCTPSFSQISNDHYHMFAAFFVQIILVDGEICVLLWHG
jgi:hypothetical protein